MKKAGILKNIVLFLVLLIAGRIHSAPSTGWATQFIDNPTYFSDFYPKAIAIEKGRNYKHIVYGKDHLYHAYFNGTSWKYETVDDSMRVGECASLGIDADNKLHIGYYDGLNADLKYFPPVAQTGVDRNEYRNTLVKLDGSESYDPNGDEITYLWAQTSGPEIVLTGTTEVNAEFTPMEFGTYTFQLTVNDGKGESSSDTVKITVDQNRKPIADAGEDQSVIVNTEVTLDGSKSYDTDGDNINFAWEQTGGFVKA